MTTAPNLYSLGEYTVIGRNESHGLVLMQVQGILPLPVGSDIELPNSPDSARVERGRLLAPDTDGTVYLCLDVSGPV